MSGGSEDKKKPESEGDSEMGKNRKADIDHAKDRQMANRHNTIFSEELGGK